MKEKLRYFSFSLAVTLAGLVGALWGLGWSAMLVTLILILVEITFSFENAVINAKVLQTMSQRWRMIFLTVGIFIAIFVMRAVFPIMIVVLTAHIPWREVLDLAFNNPDLYAEKLVAAHHTIAAFGGSFLLMLCLHFFFDGNKDVHWFKGFERRLSAWGKQWLPPVISVALILLLAALPANHYGGETIRAGLLGIATYIVVRGIEALFSKLKAQPKQLEGGKRGQKALLTGWAAFATFVYLEILDASFSFDGVIGAFAITKSVVLIALGLGVGAVWVRSLTVYMVKKGTLSTYRYLEHGAHYTVGVLALVLLCSLIVEVPEVIAGLAGVLFVTAAFISSHKANQVAGQSAHKDA